MIHKSVVLLAGVLSVLLSPARAATDPLSCFKELAETRNYSLGAPSHATPTPDGKSVLYLRTGPRDFSQRLYEFDIATAKERELITPEALLGGKAENLSIEEKARRERMRISARGFVDYGLSRDGKNVLLTLDGKLYVVDRSNGAVTALPGGGWIAPKFSPDGTRVAALKDGEIHVIDIAAKKDTQLTFGASETLLHGEAEFVAQEEMDRRDGFWWSPDSRALAYEEADLSQVEVHYIADPLHPEREPAKFRYPRAGTPNAKVRLGIIPAAGGATVWVSWDGNAYPYLTRVTWDLGAPLMLVVGDRSITREVILAADAKTGKVRLLWRERDDAWLDLPQADFPRGLPGGGFLWASERSGQWQLERHAPGGKLLNTITAKGFRFDDLLDIDTKTSSVVVSGGTDRLSRRLYRVPLGGGKALPLLDARGVHGGSFGEEQHAIFAHGYSLLDGTQGTDLRDRDGKLIAVLPSAAEKPPFLPSVEYMTVGKLGFDALVVRPRDFDPKRKYPVILEEYAGPAGKEVMATPRASFDRQCMADMGYIVATLDNRGTPGRSRAWLRAVKGNAIDIPLQDQVDGLQAIASRVPQMDIARTGVIGWSFGGYFAAMAVMRRPDIFAAGVAGAPVVDWQDYDTYYTERYLQDPVANAQGYRASNVLSYAGDLQRPLLIVSGATDDNVYFQNTMKLTIALFTAGKPYEQLVLPGTHMLADPVLRARESERVMAFFAKHLGGVK